ncbi:MAG: AMP-binding protein, partial [Pseudomonadota bacterium]
MPAPPEDRQEWGQGTREGDGSVGATRSARALGEVGSDGASAAASSTSPLPGEAHLAAFTTLGDMLITPAEHAPHRVCFSFLAYRHGRNAERSTVTYGGLLSHAKAVAARLQQISEPGDRVLILCHPGLTYIAAFFACQLAGMVAVPAYPPRNPKHMGRLEAIVRDAGASAVLTTADVEAQLERWSGRQAGRAPSQPLPTLVAIDNADAEAAHQWTAPATAPEDLAFLQYTSGTTGTPKGVMVTHQQVLENISIIVSNFSLGADAAGVSWLPPYHDMGLVAAILVPVHAGFPATLMAPGAFLQRPSRWLEALSVERATITAAPNFAWQLCVDAATEAEIAALDLSSLRFALSGAEPVRATTVAALATTLRPCGFQAKAVVPVYGMAEMVLLSSSADVGHPAKSIEFMPASSTGGGLELTTEHTIEGPLPPQSPSAQRIVSCGRAIAGHDLAIVDAQSGQLCPDGSVGEIWLSGPSVAAGYWNKPAETNATFGAHLTGDASGKRWLRTGDLGALLGGELCILGRIREMVIVRGRNFYAQDLEATAEAADPILGHDRTIAFGIEDDSGEQLVIVHETTRSSLRAINPEDLAAAIRTSVLDLHDIAVGAVVFVKPASLPRTTSGKLQRRKAQALYQNDDLHAAAQSLTRKRANSTVDAETSRATADRLIDWLRTYAPREINAFEMDERRTVPPHIVNDFAKAGLFGLTAPRDLNGLGLTVSDGVRVLEQLGAIDPAIALMVAIHNGLGLATLVAAAPVGVRNQLIPDLAAGRGLAAFALTEPGAGSNPRALRTTAHKTPSGGWRLSGQKSWIGLGAWAQAVVVICRLQDGEASLGYGAFVVERGAPGFRVGPEALTLGVRAIPQNTLYFDDVWVADEAMLGLPGEGLSIAFDTLRFGRLGLAAIALGIMKRCATLMARYAERRRVGTGRLIDNGVTRARLERLAARIHTVDSLVRVTVAMLDRGEALSEDLYNVTKITVPEYLWQATDDLVQLLGGRGYEEPNEAARLLRDARLFRIFEGPTETVGVHLGGRLVFDRAELPSVLSGLSGDALAARIDRAIEGARTATGGTPGEIGEAALLALGQMAAAATLLAIVRHRAERGAQKDLAEQHLLDEIADAERRVRAAVTRPPTEPAALISLIAGYADEIGAIESDTARPVSHADVLLRRDPDGPFVGDDHVTRTQALLDARVDPADEPLPLDGTPRLSLLPIRREVAALVGLPPRAIAADTELATLGLDSLQAARLVARLEAETGKTLPLKTFFEATTVADLAAALEVLAPAWTAVALTPADRAAPLPLSYQQERLWFLDKLDGLAGAAYHLEGALRLSGELNTEALQQALKAVVARHENFRTHFVAGDDGHPVQIIAP